MRIYIEERCREIAKYMIYTQATCRECAKKFGISKATVHKDMRERLKDVDSELHLQVGKVLDLNKAEAHLRGGLATQEKFRK